MPDHAAFRPTLSDIDVDGRLRSRAETMEIEWLEADGLGGFASGTASGVRTRRYHAILLCAARPPSDRFVLVQDVEAWLETSSGCHALSTSVYPEQVLHPDGIEHLRRFESWPWPRWSWSLPDGTVVEAELFVPRGQAAVCCRWRRTSGTGPALLRVRPRLGPRDPHGEHGRNETLDPGVRIAGDRLTFELYDGVPPVSMLTSGSYRHHPVWFERCVYVEERARGLSDREDLFSPGEFTYELEAADAVLVLGTGDAIAALGEHGDARGVLHHLERGERDRRTRLGRRGVAREAYVARRNDGPVLLAGFPWFGEWGRDTFIAMRGLCLATGRFEEALAVLEAWTDTIADGMVPNRLPDRGDEPEYNSVDASLWFGIVVHELLAAYEVESRRAGRLLAGVDAVIDGFVAGTRHGIRVDDDGLVAAGEPGVQLTWMDAKVGERVVTPRVGKPIEVQALWLTLLAQARHRRPDLAGRLARGLRAVEARFCLPDLPWLADVVDVDHVSGRVDATLRPNQVHALGGLPLPIVQGARARAALDSVESSLWTPLGLRSLAPGHLDYVGRYRGGVSDRDGAYHQGTAWPHLLGPFVEAWLRMHASEPDARSIARHRFLAPLLHHLDAAGLGHVSEIVDGDAPHGPRGAPFQAWALGELIRLETMLVPEGGR